MCGRVIQSSGPLRLAIVEGLDVSDSRMVNIPPRYNAAPSQELLVIRQNHKTNKLVAQIHDRMPAILEPACYYRWLGLEPDPHDLLVTYLSEPMTMWPISTRVNKPQNDDPS